MRTIIIMRDLLKAMNDFEVKFEETYRISLNEAMILCTLKSAGEKLAASKLSKETNLSPSHTSKMLRILEEKQLIDRFLGVSDKRQMYFTLTPAGGARVAELEDDKIEIPSVLKPVFKAPAGRPAKRK
ncbi:MAG: winged helix DNA-binding protein [Mediterranea sp.]|nr:winged helix DNA-binding protein [Mediterranea sp.]